MNSGRSFVAAVAFAVTGASLAVAPARASARDGDGMRVVWLRCLAPERLPMPPSRRLHVELACEVAAAPAMHASVLPSVAETIDPFAPSLSDTVDPFTPSLSDTVDPFAPRPRPAPDRLSRELIDPFAAPPVSDPDALPDVDR